MGGGGGCASLKFKTAAKKIFVQTCGSFCQSSQSHVLDASVSPNRFCDSPDYAIPPRNQKRNFSCKKGCSEISDQGDSSTSPSSNKHMCAICLDPLNYSSGNSPGKAIFTAQCSHAFHFACIASNVRHGSVTCPICRAQWTQLPRNLNTRCSIHYNKTDPVLRIIDDSIANSRVHRRSFLRSARYDDDDPVEPDHTSDQPRLRLSLLTASLVPPSFNSCSCLDSGTSSCHCCRVLSNHVSGSSSIAGSPLAAHLFPSVGAETPPFLCSPNNGAYLCVRLSHQPATDLVLVMSPNGPHLRLMKQSMTLVVSSLRPIDRLAIVTYSSAASRVFPLRRMTSYGKRTALQVIERLFYTGQADPMEGLKKGVKILGDRVHKNPRSCILHLADTPSRSYHQFDMEIPVRVCHVGFGFGASNGFVMQEFEEFLARTLGGAIRDIQLRIGESSRIISIGELRGGEERNLPLYLGESGHISVEYSYIDGGEEGECVRRGEIVVHFEDKREIMEGHVPVDGRISSAEGWDYHDPFMARRWAKHLHGYRL
ncbi:Zinc finger family protein isoform 1 [Dorcoceras hygrometricum]|uniref:Zinc finger family protein isoform 1 n=1 Tax=Dorcoceras hygrometricum TaxID=472368 RepID=A0A2Z7BEL1_9LAMI|nr:Zinc finger family protein isoform 1 [Dorcoceras hygrometricum]